MAADEISKTVKSDPFICIYGEAYLNKHRRKQIATKVSNELREFSRLLLELRQTVGVKTMFDCLKPEFYPAIVDAVKTISGYDEKTHTYKAPSLALHKRTNLSHLYQAGQKVLLLKHANFRHINREEGLRNLKDLKRLIDDHFTKDCSSLALKDLNEKKWKKKS